MHHLVRLCEPYRVYLSQAHELDKGAEHGFHGALAFALHVTALWTLHPLDVTFVFFAVVGDTELLLLCTFAQTGTMQRTIDTDVLSCTVLLLPGTRPVIVEDLGERDHLFLGTNVMVRRFNIFEARWPALVGAMRGNETFKVPCSSIA